MRLTVKKNDKYNIAYGNNKGASLKYFSTATEEVKQIIDKCNNVFQKLGQLEDIEDRLSKFKDIGIDGLITLFKNLTDEDIEFIVQRAFKMRSVL